MVALKLGLAEDWLNLHALVSANKKNSRIHIALNVILGRGSEVSVHVEPRHPINGVVVHFEPSAQFVWLERGRMMCWLCS